MNSGWSRRTGLSTRPLTLDARAGRRRAPVPTPPPGARPDRKGGRRRRARRRRLHGRQSKQFSPCETTHCSWMGRRWWSSTRPAWLARTTYANSSLPRRRPGLRQFSSGTPINWPRSRLEAACSPNCAAICPGRSTFRRCGGCETLPSARPHSRCGTADPRRSGAPSTGTAPMTAYTPATR